jgi:large subunit ribosomal protein L3
MIGLLARKVGMTQVFDSEGNAVAVTILELLENVVTAQLTQEKNGYNAIQVGADEVKAEKVLSKGEVGNLKKKNLKLFRTLKEFRVSDELVKKYEVGAELDAAEILGAEGSLVDVSGRPIGKGTTGRIKRWNQSRRRMSHGTKHHRQIGSAGAGTTPGRVFKGLNMPGRDNENITISHLKFFKYIPEKKAVLVKGAVPGFDGALLWVKQSKKAGEWNKTALLVGKRKAA